MVYIAYAIADAYEFTNSGLKITASGSATSSGDSYMEAYSTAKKIATKIKLVNDTNKSLITSKYGIFGIFS